MLLDPALLLSPQATVTREVTIMQNHTYTYHRNQKPNWSWLPTPIIVSEDTFAVLAVDGRLDSVLPTGRHRIRTKRQTVHYVPAVEHSYPVVGQEMLTQDGAAVRATVVASVRVTDPLTLLRQHGTRWTEALYLEVQLALRGVVAGLDLEELIDRRTELDPELTAPVKQWAEARGIEVVRVVVRDLGVPGALKQAVANVIGARLEGRAALERARGETAALRSLANAARAVGDNPALLQLRLLQQMEASNSNTYVIGNALPTPGVVA